MNEAGRRGITLDEVIARVPGWAAAGRAVVATPLSGGITNTNYRVEVAGELFVVRLGGQGTYLLGIDRAAESAAARVAARLGVGPEVVWSLPEAGVLVTRFVPGRTLAPEDVRRPDTLRRVLAAVRQVHEGPPMPGRFAPVPTIEAYADIARRHGVAVPSRFDEWLELVRRIQTRLSPRPWVPCHNDLLGGNFVDDGSRIRILDWEYAAMGDPFFDLGNLAANAELDPEGEHALLTFYAGAAPAESQAQLGLMRVVSDLREAAWALVQRGISHLAFDFAEYADRHLDRLAAAVAAPRVAAWLG